MLARILIVLGAGVIGFLGAMHLVYTFFSNKFDARDPAVSAAMKATSPVLTRRTSLWNAWIGFNGSHGLGVVLFAATYLVLALGHMSVLRESGALTWLPVAGSAAYLALAKRYWFRTPLVGVAIATLCFLIGACALTF
ncbi:MAG TPA: hypothetical protein VH278_05605 [Burkholderiaceae bacterium]|nr:hypothetical protein [Burkholderiaceae bacterium]